MPANIDSTAGKRGRRPMHGHCAGGKTTAVYDFWIDLKRRGIIPKDTPTSDRRFATLLQRWEERPRIE
jgi:hypothetical protein